MSTVTKQYVLCIHVSSVGRGSCMECVGRGLESHMSVAFSLKKKLSQVLCCVVSLSF